MRIRSVFELRVCINLAELYIKVIVGLCEDE